ncbi:highly derived d5-like helicase-primase: PROVISIONAL [Gigaspora margarita]|uniref:Highly derived d5-like helicase-primase: PROVISIONAL n=1 Tax=Gigaspora margarita TaxID=4874 RepID=A0A8H3X7V4_GIGMA|nr:highly derived d5-like helicase-primase: PROVISIONAL [Gigaspora margarita]
MSTKATAPKTRKAKANKFVLILEQFLEKHNLMADSTPEQLREHAPELNVQLHDWKARKCVKDLLVRRTKKRWAFSKEQIEALVPDKRKEKLTIEERAKYCAKSGDKWDIFIHSRDIGPKSNDDKEIVAGCSRLSLFHNELLKVDVAHELIDTYAKDSDVTTASNKIQKERTEQDVANNWLKIPSYFSLEKGLKRIQNINTTNNPSLQDLADIIVMLCMRPAKVSSLQINYYEVDLSNPSAWYKNGYSWYCTGYAKNKGENKDNPEPHPFLSMEKNPERARALLIWIQEAIKAKKLSDSTFSENGKRNTRVFSEFLKPHKITPKILRKIRSKHACRVHGGPNPTHQHLDLLNRIALRHKIVRLDAGKNYAIGDTESEESDSEPETSDSLKPQIQASSSFQTIEIDSILAEIDAMLAEIQK